MKFRPDELVKVIEAPPYLSQGGTVIGQSADGEIIFVRFEAAIPIALLYHPGIVPDAYSEIRDGNYECSFCGRAQREVGRLVQGRSGYICDKCIGVCMQIVIEAKEKA